MSDKHSAPGAFAVPGDIKISDTKFPDHEVSVERPQSDPQERGNYETALLEKARPFRFVATWRFWGILAIGQILSWCIVSTNTLTQYLSLDGAIIPAFQTVFNYALLNLVYTSYTLYKYGFKKWFTVVFKDGWKYFILAFVDVQGVFPHLLEVR